MPDANITNPESHWIAQAAKYLKGRTIVAVRYATPHEAEELMWDSRPVVIELDDGSLAYPSRDDEGNDGGALFGNSSNGKSWELPVLRC